MSGCQSVPVSGSAAACAVSYPAAGAHAVVAAYSGASGFPGRVCPQRPANLNRADLSGADLSGADLAGANLNDVIWSNTTCPDDTNSNIDGGTCLGHL